MVAEESWFHIKVSLFRWNFSVEGYPKVLTAKRMVSQRFSRLLHMALRDARRFSMRSTTVLENTGSRPVLPVWMSFTMSQLAMRKLKLTATPLQYLRPYVIQGIQSTSTLALSWNNSQHCAVMLDHSEGCIYLRSVQAVSDQVQKTYRSPQTGPAKVLITLRPNSSGHFRTLLLG